MSNTLFRVIQKVKSRIVPTVLVRTTNYTIKEDEALYGCVVSNLGATGEVTFTLPVAAPGMRVSAVVQAAQLLTLQPAVGGTILGTAGVAQTLNAPIKGNAVGETLQLVCFTPNRWVVVAFNGVWTPTAA
jgi:hypothetical protein